MQQHGAHRSSSGSSTAAWSGSRRSGGRWVLLLQLLMLQVCSAFQQERLVPGCQRWLEVQVSA
jgi:hypothetical protein